MNPPSFAWRSVTRQPARSFLAVVGIAVVGALLFDMLLLSRGLVISFRDLLDGAGFDVRVTAGQWVPSRGGDIEEAARVEGELRGLPEVEDVLSLRFGRAEISRKTGRTTHADFMGVSGNARGAWTILQGSELGRGDGDLPEILINRHAAKRLGAATGDTVRVRGNCERGLSALPTIDYRVAGIVRFRFDSASRSATVTTVESYERSCQPQNPDEATLFLVASRAEPEEAVAAIETLLPELRAYTNGQFVERMRVTDFSYFRQISFALSTITLFFSFLLIATLLTVSVNQRLGEIAALRALGFRKHRVVADLLCESSLLVVSGGLLALPLGGLLAMRLDAILRQMPGLPMDLHFFVFHGEAVVRFALLLGASGALATVYPVYLAARLPITQTLRREVIS